MSDQNRMDEGKMKEIASDLESLDHGNFQKKYKKTKDELRGSFKGMKEEKMLDEAVLDLQQRMKRGQIMRRYAAKIERSRELARKKLAPESNIKKRAYSQARQIVRQKVAGSRGAEYASLGPTEKMAIDRAVQNKQKAIKKLALRLIPKVKQAEQKRLSSFMKGSALKPEHTHVNEDFKAKFDKKDSPTDVDKKIQINPKKKTEVIQHSLFDDEVKAKSPVYKGIVKKATKSGISEQILGTVYDRGMEHWALNEHLGAFIDQQQYAFARVNSYINKGKTYFNEDGDLHEISKKTLSSYERKAHQDIDKRSTELRKHSFGIKGDTTETEYFAMVDKQKSRSKSVNLARSKQGMGNAYGNLRADQATQSRVKATNESNEMISEKFSKTKEYFIRSENPNINNTPVSGKIHKMTETHVILKTVGGTGTYKTPIDNISHDRKDGWMHKKYMASKQVAEGFKNWTFEMNPGDKTKVIHGDHKGKKGVVTAKHNGGESYTLKHDDGSEMTHHISTLCEPITEATNTAARRKLEATDRKAPNVEATKQAEIKQKIVDEELDSKFSTMFKETVTRGDKAPVVVQAHNDAYGNLIPAKTVMRKKQTAIIDSGNVHDGGKDN